MSVQITCIKKDERTHENPHLAISSMKWIDEATKKVGNSTPLQIYSWIKDKGGYAYVRDEDGTQVRIGTATSESGEKYVRAYRDKAWTDNLLVLSECS